MITAKIIPITTHTEPSLTEIEALGLASQYDLANGHASHELSPQQVNIIQKLPALWQLAASQKSHDAESAYKHAFQLLANTPSVSHYQFYKICPTASCSIDIAAAWLAERKLKTALIEPTFDNLYLLLKRRGVALTAMPEEALHDGNYNNILKQVDAIFLVNPNNPTGRIISKELFSELCAWCAANKKVMVLDHSFRFFVPQEYDIYQILLDSGVTFISLEDTGKVWPTQEIKASLVFTSANIFHEIDIIYDEIFLCHSNFALAILTEFLTDAHKRGLDISVWKQVAERRARLRKAIEGDILKVSDVSQSSMISVEWVNINKYFLNDNAFSRHFRLQHLIILPGRQFYWNHKGRHSVSGYIRFALMKPEHEFSNAILYLQHELQRLA